MGNDPNRPGQAEKPARQRWRKPKFAKDNRRGTIDVHRDWRAALFSDPGLHRLSDILGGDLEEITTALQVAEQEERMAAEGS